MHPTFIILIASSAEWQALLYLLDQQTTTQYPFGEFFDHTISGHSARFVRTGWGKISAAAATQCVIDHWKPNCIINIGTCGGIAGRTRVGDIILANETLIYDLLVEMGDPIEEHKFYEVAIDLKWLGDKLPSSVKIAKILTGDRDLRSQEIAELIDKHEAIVADWESGAVAFVASRNKLPCVILRYVTDLVSAEAGELYEKQASFFEGRCVQAISDLLSILPEWLDLIITRPLPA
jgi:adenosylhomocysteine nucleosidase